MGVAVAVAVAVVVAAVVGVVAAVRVVASVEVVACGMLAVEGKQEVQQQQHGVVEMEGPWMLCAATTWVAKAASEAEETSGTHCSATLEVAVVGVL